MGVQGRPLFLHASAWTSGETPPCQKLRSHIQHEIPALLYELLLETPSQAHAASPKVSHQCRGGVLPQTPPSCPGWKSSREVSEEGPRAPSAALVVSQRNSQLEKDADATTRQNRHWKNAHPPLTVPGPKSARFFCCHRGEEVL